MPQMWRNTQNCGGRGVRVGYILKEKEIKNFMQIFGVEDILIEMVLEN